MKKITSSIIAGFFLIHSVVAYSKYTSQYTSNCNSETKFANALIKYGNNSDGIPALHYAIKVKDLAAVIYLLKGGADPNARIPIFPIQEVEFELPETALHFAAIYGNKSVVEVLVAYGADITPLFYTYGNGQKSGKKSPLHFAAQFDNAETIKTLISLGIDVYHIDREGMTPMHHAAKHNRLKALNAFLEMGVFLDVYSQRAGTPLHSAMLHHTATLSKDTSKTIQFLLENGANPNTLYIALNDNLQRNHSLFFVRDPLIASLLLNYGANPNVRNQNGCTPLHHMASWSTSNSKSPSSSWWIDSIEVLILNGADVNAKNNQGKTPLDVCFQEDIQNLLLKHGASKGI